MREDFVIYEDGAKEEVQSFSRDELPLAIALVLDRSGSVAPYIYELRRIAERTLEDLKPEDKVALFSFAADVQRVEELTTDRRRIADGIRGEIIHASSVACFGSALGRIISHLRLRYSVGYYAPGSSQGAFHSIVVRLDDRFGKVGSDYFIHTRRGYYATADRIRVP